MYESELTKEELTDMTTEPVIEKQHKILDKPILMAILLFITGTFGFSIIFSLLFKLIFSSDMSDLLHEFLGVIISVTSYLIPAIFIKKRLDNKFRLGFTYKNIKLSLFLAIPFIAWPVTDAAICFIMGINEEVTVIRIFTAFFWALAPGISEELCIRSLVLGNMVRCWKDKPGAIYRSVIISSVIFGMVHIINLLAYNPNSDASVVEHVVSVLIQVAYCTANGMLYGAIYIRTHNIWGCIFSHVVINFFSYLVSASLFDENSLAQVLIYYVIYIVYYVLISLYMIRPSKHNEIMEKWS